MIRERKDWKGNPRASSPVYVLNNPPGVLRDTSPPPAQGRPTSSIQPAAEVQERGRKNDLTPSGLLRGPLLRTLGCGRLWPVDTAVTEGGRSAGLEEREFPSRFWHSLGVIVCPGLPARTFPPPVPLCKSFPGPPRGIVFVLSRITFLILFFSVQKLMSALGVHRLQIIHLLSSYFRNFPFKRKLQFSFSHYFQRTRKKSFFFLSKRISLSPTKISRENNREKLPL